jgi:putative transposase
MPYDPKEHHRRSIRLKGYDYASPGWYYLTICTFERQFLFGEIVRDQMRPSVIGEIARECWNEIPQHFPRATLDVSVVMPNHLHGILILGEEVGARHGVPPRRAAAFGQPVPGSLAVIVGQFKQAVTRRVEAQRGAAAAAQLYGHATAWPRDMPWHARTSEQGASRQRPALEIWHKNYYEHVIDNEKDLQRIREYICTNPLRWRYDVENPDCDSSAADDIEELLEAEDDEL